MGVDTLGTRAAGDYQIYSMFDFEKFAPEGEKCSLHVNGGVSLIECKDEYSYFYSENAFKDSGPLNLQTVKDAYITFPNQFDEGNNEGGF
jgi:hypothetical protein